MVGKLSGCLPDPHFMETASVLTRNRLQADREVKTSLSASVFGAGPTGALLALGLARLGCSVTLQDPLDLDALGRRSRAYAITHSSRRLLQRLDLWDDLQPHLVPFRQLRLQDESVAPLVWFGADDLKATNRAHGVIGWILDHKPLMRLLLHRLEQQPDLTLRLGHPPSSLHSESAPCSDLLIAADGPRSPHRLAWGFPFWSRSYRQGCLTAKVLLRGATPGAAYEFFRSEGPFAVLPLGGQAYQVVWSAPLRRCQDLAGLDPSALLDRLATVLPDGLVPDALLDQPMAVPLQLSLAPRLGQRNQLLVGESGHRCHPVGGQGLNLCWRDVADLLDLVERHQHQSISVRRLVRRYSRSRLPDLLLVALSTDLLLRVFSNRSPLLLPIRALGLALMQRVPRLRRVALQAMSDGPMTFLQAPPEWRSGGRPDGVQL